MLTRLCVAAILVAAALANKRCCSPDFIFVVDITDGSGFSTDDAERYVSQFMSTTVTKNSQRDCDVVLGALVEYGTRARVRFNFNRYPSSSELAVTLADYSPGDSLGDTSNARAGFAAARLLLTNAAQGHRDTTTTIFWLVHSTPDNQESLRAIADQLTSQLDTQIVVVAVGDGLDNSVVSEYAYPNQDFYLEVSKPRFLLKYCEQFDADFCPGLPNPTKPNFTTQPNPTKPYFTTPRPTQPNPTTPSTKYTKPWYSTAQPNPTDPPTRPTKPWFTTGKPNPTNPTTRPTLPDPPVPADEYCFQCINRRNQKDHYADPTECHHYYQCFYFNETFAVGIRRECPVGTYWHESVLQCMPEGPIPCFDQCENDAIAARGCYAGTGCRQFFVCANTASYGMCCPEGTSFNVATCGCDENPTCLDTCVQQGPTVPTTVAPSSGFNSTVCQDSWGTYIAAAVGEANAFYLIDTEGNPTEKQYCPAGVEFSLTTCSCSVFNDYALNPTLPVEKRQALLWLPFDSNLQDRSVNKFNVFAYDGAARDATDSAFGGGSLAVLNGHLEIPGLKSYDFRAAASWCAFFRCNGACANGGILNNNRDETSNEFTIRLSTTNGGGILSRVQLWHPVGIQTVQSGGAGAGWNHVCVTYDSNAVNLYLNGANVDSVGISGYLSIAYCPYTIGFDHTYGYFNGNVDDVLFTPFAMTAAEMTAHRTGDRAYLQSVGFF